VVKNVKDTRWRQKTQKSESSQEKIVWVKALKKFTKSSLKWQISNSLILPQENPENIV